MTDSNKVISETPAAEVPTEVLDQKPEATPGEETKLSPREAVRQSMEEKVSQANEPEGIVEETVTPKDDTKPADEVTPDKAEDVLKKNIQKRIDKLTAQKKSAEEQLAELKAENERLRNQRPETADSKKQDAEPTIEQIEAYIIKCKQEGDVVNEVAATRYLIKREKEEAIKAVKAEQEAQQRQAAEATAKQQADWINLNKDYESDNPDLDLKNQNGLLYKEALRLFMDPDLKEVYSDPDRISAFRKAVHDTHRYITENGLHLKRSTPSETIDTTPRVRVKNQLADPSADSAEETSPVVSKNLSDAEKVKEEILNRRKNRTLR